MKFGLVGVGPWGQRLALKLQQAGHTIAYHDRKHGSIPTTGLGEHLPWREMVKVVQGIVIATPPDATTEIAAVAAKLGKTVLATKPLFGAVTIMDAGVRAPFVVDYVHLRSPMFIELCSHIEDKKNVRIAGVEAQFYDDGPVRGFPALFDYGPHAISCIFEVLETGMFELTKAKRHSPERGRELIEIEADVAGVPAKIAVGNIGERHRRVLVNFEDGSWAGYEENFPTAEFSYGGPGETAHRERVKHDPLKQVMRDLEPSPLEIEPCYTLDLEMSADVEEALSTIRQACGGDL
jgi:predicted dehydrogenase